MRSVIKFVLPALALSAVLSACGSSSSSSGTSSAAGTTAAPSATTIKTAPNSKLGGTILVDSKGMTLYHLTAESGGKFICTTSSCLSLWHPLTVSGAVTPSGSVGSLSLIKRPGGAMQVTYKGEPLYTFANDTAPGQAKGQGFKDVGTWMAATVGAASKSSSSSSSTTSTGYGGSAYP